jgi:hypothetical protein
MGRVSHCLLGQNYGILSIANHAPHYCDYAVANDRKYRGMSPKDSEVRIYVPAVIKNLEKDKSDYLAEQKK